MSQTEQNEATTCGCGGAGHAHHDHAEKPAAPGGRTELGLKAAETVQDSGCGCGCGGH